VRFKLWHAINTNRGHDPPDTPDIDLCAINGLSHEQLRRSIPPRHHHVGIKAILPIVYGFREYGSCETEIGYLEVPVVIDKDVG
jgi:hypothetical protein